MRRRRRVEDDTPVPDYSACGVGYTVGDGVVTLYAKGADATKRATKLVQQCGGTGTAIQNANGRRGMFARLDFHGSIPLDAIPFRLRRKLKPP